ncbi:MAG: hypothetical protein M3P43_06930 [Actinomycetota bacterium]|nr:hypothetical protein [Actinomycetota bacterium]
MSRACSVCESPQVTAVDADLAAGASIRAVSRQYGLSRSTVARHRAHTAPSVPLPASGDPLEEAARLFERAGSERERLRALEAIRAALDLELRDFAKARVALKSPTDDQLAQLQANLVAAREAYERVADGSFDNAARALQGLRAAVAALRAATARTADDPVQVRFATAEGDELATMTMSAEAFLNHHQVPQRYRDGKFKVIVGMGFAGPPTVTVYQGEQVVWQRLPPQLPRERRPHVDHALLMQEPGGNGHHDKDRRP